MSGEARVADAAVSTPDVGAGDLDLRLCQPVGAPGGLFEEPGHFRCDFREVLRRTDIDAVIVAMPAPSAVSLLAVAPKLAEQAGKVRYAPCWSLMLGFPVAMTLRSRSRKKSASSRPKKS